MGVGACGHRSLRPGDTPWLGLLDPGPHVLHDRGTLRLGGRTEQRRQHRPRQRSSRAGSQHLISDAKPVGSRLVTIGRRLGVGKHKTSDAGRVLTSHLHRDIAAE